MGTVISKAANGVGSVLGTAIVAPFKSIFNGSCEDVCPGAWDIVCFVEHLCVTNLVKLLMILGLCYIILLFCYLLFKLGICQCIVKSLCKMCWAACETYWYALEGITCFLWHKLLNTKRRNRRRLRRHIRDAELGYSSSEESDFPENHHHHHHHRRHHDSRHLSSSRKRYREGTNWRGNGSHRGYHHLKLKSRRVSFRARGGSRQLRAVKVGNPRISSKRRRLR